MAPVANLPNTNQITLPSISQILKLGPPSSLEIYQPTNLGLPMTYYLKTPIKSIKVKTSRMSSTNRVQKPNHQALRSFISAKMSKQAQALGSKKIVKARIRGMFATKDSK